MSPICTLLINILNYRGITYYSFWFDISFSAISGINWRVAFIMFYILSCLYLLLNIIILLPLFVLIWIIWTVILMRFMVTSNFIVESLSLSYTCPTFHVQVFKIDIGIKHVYSWWGFLKTNWSTGAGVGTYVTIKTNYDICNHKNKTF